MKKNIYLLVIIFMILLIGQSTISLAKDKLKVIEQLIEKDNIEKAVEKQKDLTNKDKEAGSLILLDYLKDIEEKVRLGKMDSVEALKKINLLKEVEELREEVEKSIKRINKIENSRDSFRKAELLEGKNNYIKAIEEYKKIIKDDKLNYLEAQKRINEVKNRLERAI